MFEVYATIDQNEHLKYKIKKIDIDKKIAGIMFGNGNLKYKLNNLTNMFYDLCLTKKGAIKKKNFRNTHHDIVW